jgi:DNA-binding SARP family transcriptional activator/pimeloyl-ACP methyl ester carboxylesterase
MIHAELDLLGGFHLVAAGTELRLPTRKAEALIACLELAPDRARSREALIGLLWGDRSETQARHSLSQTLSSIRRAFGDAGAAPIVLADGGSIALESGRVDLDVDRFEQRAAEGIPEALGEAAALYRGDLLEGLRLREEAFEEWLAGERSRLRERALRVFLVLLEQLAAAGRTDDAVQTALRLLALDPLQESVHRQLMRLYAAQGRRTTALRQYELCARTLRDELGVEPEAETTKLCGEIKRQRESRAGTAPGQLAGAAARPDASRPGEARLVGEPGVAGTTQQEISFCRTPDGVRLAWAKVGQGPPLVKTANWLNHVEYDWESPVWRYFLEALASRYTLIRYDARGNGLSDWEVEDVSLDAWVSDLETVVDAAGVARFPLLGMSQGCAISIAYAVRHPDRVSHLILYGGYALGGSKRSPAEKEKREAMATLMGLGWGTDDPSFRQLFTSQFMPDGSKEQFDHFNELQRRTTTPEGAVRYFRTVGAIDVRHLLPRVTVPTLVMHVRADRMQPIEAGREIAAGIPGARFVSLPGQNHMFLQHEPAADRFFEEVALFLS